MKILGSARAILLIGASLTVASTATAVQAQNEQAPAARDAGTNEGDIVVTALRRSESLQDVPAAITAFTSEAIETAGIERPSDFINLTSNVNLVETQNAGNAFIIIRGITQARNSEPSVAVVVDGVQQVNPAQFNQELFDIEQIEVLKGPQGAIYGRNAIGGAIVIRTKQPTDHFEGRVRAGIDNGFGYWLRGGISGPMSDTLKFRLSGSWYDTKGFIRNEFLKEDTDPVEDLALRGTLLWSPTSNFTADLRGSISRLRTQALYFNIVNDVNDTSLPVRTNNAGQNDRDINNVSLRLNYDTDAGSFSSVTSYDTLKEILTGDAFDFLPIEESLFFQIFGFDLTQSQYLNVKALSQEIRFTSPEANRLRYIVGAYFIDTNRFISTGNMIDTDSGVFPVYRTPSTNPLNPQFSFLSDKQDNFAWAAFANLSYDFTDQFKIDLGLRYDRDRRRNTTLTPAGFMNGPGLPDGTTGEVRKAVFDDWQPKVTLTWEPSNTVTLYGGYSRGFRSGGFNQTGVGGVAAGRGQRHRRGGGPVPGRDRRHVRGGRAHPAARPASDAQRQRLYDGIEEQLFLRLPGRQLDPESGQRAAHADQRLRAGSDGAARPRPRPQRRLRLYEQQHQGLPRPRLYRQRSAADLALYAQHGLAIPHRRRQRCGADRAGRLPADRQDLVGRAEFHRAQAGRSGRCAASRGVRPLLRRGVRVEPVQREI